MRLYLAQVVMQGRESETAPIKNYKNLSYQFYPLDDARYLAFNNHNIFCVTGANSGLWVKSRTSSKDDSHFVTLNGAPIPESKSSVELSDKFIFLGLGMAGASILSIDDYKIVGQIPQNEHTDLSKDVTVTNSVSAGLGEVYTADGEAGSRVFEIDEQGQLEELASVRFGPGISVNAVKKYKEYIVYATGLGGIKIAHLYRADLEKRNQEFIHYRRPIMDCCQFLKII